MSQDLLYPRALRLHQPGHLGAAVQAHAVEAVTLFSGVVLSEAKDPCAVQIFYTAESFAGNPWPINPYPVKTQSPAGAD